MSPEPAESQILKQLLGHDLGSMVFGLYTLAGSAGQLSQQVAQQAEEIERLKGEAAPPPASDGQPSADNPWTGPTPEPKEGP